MSLSTTCSQDKPTGLFQIDGRAISDTPIARRYSFCYRQLMPSLLTDTKNSKGLCGIGLVSIILPIVGSKDPQD